MCCSLGKKRMTDALRSCDYCTTSQDERSACYKAVARDRPSLIVLKRRIRDNFSFNKVVGGTRIELVTSTV